MPITALNSRAETRHRCIMDPETVIVQVRVGDEVFAAPLIWLQTVGKTTESVTSGGVTLVLKGLPGAIVGTHYHVGNVHGYTLRGH